MRPTTSRLFHTSLPRFALLALGLGLLGQTSAHAGNITLSSANGGNFATSAGSPLSAGALVRVGAFTLPASTVATTTDYSALNAAFRPLAEGTANGGSPLQLNGSGNALVVNSYPSAGHVFGTIRAASTNYIAQDTPLYLWVFTGSTAAGSAQWGIYTATAWKAPNDNGAVTLSTSADGLTALQGSIVSGQLRLATPTPSLGNWTLANFPAGTSAALTTSNADPDGDGLSNLAEYAWRLSPMARNGAHNRSSFSKPAGASAATFTFKAPRGLPNVSVSAETSADLITWTPAASAVTASDEDFDTRTCTANANATRTFWRVKFTQQ